MTVGNEKAETIAIQALAFLADDPNRMERFLTLTGMSPSDIRREAQTPVFLASILEYLLNDEPLLLVFCSNASLSPDTIAPAFYTLVNAANPKSRNDGKKC